jgi:hypothetical protein
MIPCSLYDVNGTCTSGCESCGVLCEAFPIRDLDSLSLYKKYGCNIISGDLYIIELPVEVTKAILYDNLHRVRAIQGHLYVMHNAHITSMTFFEHLERVDGITYINNPSLADAHLNSLESLDIPTRVEGCARLCPARYTESRDSGASEDACANPGMRFYVAIAGRAARGDLAVVGDVMTRVVRSLTDGQVCLVIQVASCSHNACSGMEWCECL